MTKQRLKILRVVGASSSLNQLRGQLAYLSQSYDVLAVSGGDKSILEQVSEREGVRTKFIPIHRRIGPIKDLRALWQMVRLMRKEKPDLVHSMNPKAGLLAMLAAWITRVPVRIHSFTGLIFPYRKGLFQKLLIWMDRLICFCATDIWPEGKGVRRDLMRYRITGKRLKVLAYGNINGVDLTRFDPARFSPAELMQIREELGLSSAQCVFLYCGRLVEEKGIEELVKAFIELERAYPQQAALLLLGDYDATVEKIQPLIKQNITDHPRIIHLGHRDDVCPVYALSDCLVLPSYREGFPNVVLEASAMGLPSIVTNITGSSEIIRNGQNGYVVPDRNVKKLREAMEQILQGRSNAKEMGRLARRYIERYYTNKQVWEAVEAEYRTLLKF